ncbi:MAG: SEC-C domain-containing protein [Gammaproteobacteria bacterium]|nr:SEC-C domain-containing protein [Gammaproteobacteria bacterium]MBQ0840660.1 SEC-C domain-containing protein [Gammaproteobacteria bacterium]
MSDKFFFMGRQNARQKLYSLDYGTKAGQKTGSKKYPLQLIVTSEARKQEIEAQVAEAQLYAEITVDSSADAVESISELTVQLGKGLTVKHDQTPARNEPCSCGSGKKYKKCCG